MQYGDVLSQSFWGTYGAVQLENRAASVRIAAYAKSSQKRQMVDARAMRYRYGRLAHP